MTIPLESAYLCVNCDHVGDSATRCAFCASDMGLLSVASVFNRPARDLELTDAEKMIREIYRVERKFQTCMVGV